MSRISYSEEEDYPGQFNLWRANLNRSLVGKKGRAALLDLEAALLALPEKKLIEGHLVKDGDVCATGALVALRRQQKQKQSREEILAQMREEVAPFCDTCYHMKSSHKGGGVCEKCPSSIEMTWQNFHATYYGPTLRDTVCQQYVPEEYDEDPEGEVEGIAVNEGVPRLVAWAIVEQNDEMSWGHETDEERYGRVLKWTQRRLTMPLDQAMREDMS